MSLLIHTFVDPPHPGQAEVAGAESRFGIVAAGRRWGKTVTGVAKSLKVAGRRGGGEAMWCAPTYNMARHGWDALRRVGVQIPGAELRLADRELRLPSGGRVLVRSTDRPETMRGHGLDLIVLDEAAWMKPQVWGEVLRPTLADRQGSALFISTPAGIANWLYDLWQKANEEGWQRWQFPSHTNPNLDPAELEQMRREMTTAAYAQEILAEFIAGGGGKIDPDWFHYFTVEEIAGQTYYRAAGHLWPAQGCSRFAVVDPAASTKRSADWTAVACCAITPDHRLLLLEMWRGRIEGPDQVKTISRLVDKWRLNWVGVEAVAYQRTLAQYLRRGAGLPVRDLKASTDKEDRAGPLIIRMESGDLFMLADQPWLADLEAELLAWPHGPHDDQVDALAYAAREVFARQTVLTGPLGV